MRIEAGGPRIDRIDHDESRRNGIADGQHSPERLGKQRAADALTLEGLVERQAGEQNRRDLTRTAPPNGGRSSARCKRCAASE